MTIEPVILIVEDDRAIAQFLELLLTGEGYAVRHAVDGERALASVTDEPPALLIMDVHLGRTSGRDLLTSLRTRSGHAVPTIFMTADQREVQRAEADGHAVLPKPFDIDDALELVRRLLPDAGEPCEKARRAGG